MRFPAAVLETSGAARPYAKSRPLAIHDVELPPPGRGEVLVRIRAASLCHSDLSVVNGDRAWPMPIVPGHEAAGVVEAVGEDVTAFAPDDRVVLVFLAQCGNCSRCVEGRPSLCEAGMAANRQGRLVTGGPRLTLDERPVHHHMGLSAFAERALVSEKSLVKLDGDVPFTVASLFGCAVLCGVGTVLYTASASPGQSVAVIGLGGAGLSAVMGAVLAGASQIIAVDPGAAKREMARTLGATVALDPATGDAAEAIREVSHDGVDHAIEAAGTLAAFEIAFRATRRGGSTVTLGLPPPADRFSAPLAQLVAEARTIKGSYIGTCVPRRDIPAFVELYRQGRLPVDRLITGTLGLDRINEAFDALADASAIRQVVTFEAGL
jgi:Zn-dependent alcohol dehydrogenase